MKECPCKDCDNRKFNCHKSCDEYQNFKKHCEIIRQKRQEINKSYYTSLHSEKCAINNIKKGRKTI